MNKLQNIDYFILMLNRKKISLLKLQGNEMTEISDGIFPMSFADEYEYAKSSRGTSFGYALKGFEKDKSVVKKERFSHFLQEVNKNLKGYLGKNSALILTGTNEDRTEFKRVFDHNLLIVEEVSGSFNTANVSQLKKSILTTLKHPKSKHIEN